MRWALLGCGSVAPSHALALAGADHATFVAVCDQDADRADQLATRFGVRAYRDIDTLVDAERPDAVTVALPTALHSTVTAALAASGVHVLCEKPLAASVAECDAMISACAEAGVALGVIHNYRGLPPSRWIADGIAAGRLHVERVDIGGALTRTGGGPGSARAVLDAIGVHYTDLLLWWLGPVVDAEIEGDDERITAALRFTAAEARLDLSVEPVDQPGITISVDAAEGALTYDHTGVLAHRSAHGELPAPTPTIEGARYGPGHQVVIAEAAAELHHRRRFPLDGAVGRAAVELAERIATAVDPTPERMRASRPKQGAS